MNDTDHGMPSPKDVDAHPLVAGYLKRLETAAVSLPAQRRAELLDEIRGHIEEALPPATRHDESVVRGVLQRLGDPHDIAEAAIDGEADPAATTSPRSMGGLEIAALVALTLGAFLLPVIGVALGLGLVWASSSWATRHKGVATALPIVSAALVATVFSAVQQSTPPVQGAAVWLLPDTAETLWFSAHLGSGAGGILAAALLAARGKAR